MDADWGPDCVPFGKMVLPGRIKGKLQSLTSQKEASQRILEQLHASLRAIHPNLSELYKSKVEGLHEALLSGDNTETLARLRDSIERVEIGPSSGATGLPDIVLTGALGSMVKLGLPDSAAMLAADDGLFDSSIKVVAGARFERAAFRL